MKRLCAFALPVLCVLALAPVCGAAIETNTSISIRMPNSLWDDLGSLAFITPAPGRMLKRDHFRSGGRNWSVLWEPFTANARNNADAVKYFIQGPMTAAVIDEPLSPGELKRKGLKQRVLYRDADTVFADERSPACRGMTSSQLRQILAGTLTDWHAVYADWPTDRGSKIDLWYPASNTNENLRKFFGRTSFGGTTHKTTNAGTLESDSGAIGINKLSYGRQYLTQAHRCVVPIDGVAPGESTVADHSYPFAYDVYYVDFKQPKAALRSPTWALKAMRERWYHYLWGEAGRNYLLTWNGQQRFLP